MGSDSTRRLANRPRKAGGKRREDIALDNFEMSVGGRDEMMGLLSRSTDEDAQKLLTLMETDLTQCKTGSRQAFRNLCHAVGLNLMDMVRIHVQVLNSQAALEVMKVHAERMPGLVADTYDDAASRQASCPKCLGRGKLYYRRKEIECAECSGTGKVRIPGSAPDRRLVYEAAGLIRKQGPEFSQTNIDKAVFLGGMAPLEASVKRVSKLLKEG